VTRTLLRLRGRHSGAALEVGHSAGRWLYLTVRQAPVTIPVALDENDALQLWTVLGLWLSTRGQEDAACACGHRAAAHVGLDAGELRSCAAALCPCLRFRPPGVQNCTPAPLAV